MLRSTRALPLAPREKRASARAFVVMALVMAGCGRKPVDATPEGVLREFLNESSEFRGNPKDATMASSCCRKRRRLALPNAQNERALRWARVWRRSE